uniref:Uncharacterized protein n=1 Tax=Glossina palpalis gambiensis TaxID=67801 RepID=A0A1B0B1S5_9MUSC
MTHFEIVSQKKKRLQQPSTKERSCLTVFASDIAQFLKASSVWAYKTINKTILWKFFSDECNSEVRVSVELRSHLFRLKKHFIY